MVKGLGRGTYGLGLNGPGLGLGLEGWGLGLEILALTTSLPHSHILSTPQVWWLAWCAVELSHTYTCTHTFTDTERALTGVYNRLPMSFGVLMTIFCLVMSLFQESSDFTYYLNPHAWKRAHKCPAFCLDKQKLAYPSITSFHWKITTVQGMVHSPHCTHRPLALTNTVWYLL